MADLSREIVVQEQGDVYGSVFVYRTDNTIELKIEEGCDTPDTILPDGTVYATEYHSSAVAYLSIEQARAVLAAFTAAIEGWESEQ